MCFLQCINFYISIYCTCLQGHCYLLKPPFYYLWWQLLILEAFKRGWTPSSKTGQLFKLQWGTLLTNLKVRAHPLWSQFLRPCIAKILSCFIPKSFSKVIVGINSKNFPHSPLASSHLLSWFFTIAKHCQLKPLVILQKEIVTTWDIVALWLLLYS